MKLKNILGMALLSGASFVAGHDFALIYPIVPKNESMIKQHYKILLEEEKIKIEYKNLYDDLDLNPDIRALKVENIRLINRTWVYRLAYY